MMVYNVDYFFGFFLVFNVDVVKDVKLFKGVFLVKYGGWLFSVVDLIGKMGDFNKLYGSVGFNFLNVKVSV